MDSAARKILIVDDELSIVESLAHILQGLGFHVATAVDGVDGLEQTSNFIPDLIILDVDMPRLDGRSVLRQLRKANNWVPVILLTKVGSSVDRTFALEEGADDYLHKPFDVHELIARIKAILRRANLGKKSLASSNILTTGHLEFNRLSRRIHFQGTELHLTPKAVSLLEYFLLHPDEVISRDRLLDILWGWTSPAGTRSVDSRIYELRKALNDDPDHAKYIETVPAQGYRFIGEVKSI